MPNCSNLKEMNDEQQLEQLADAEGGRAVAEDQREGWAIPHWPAWWPEGADHGKPGPED
jgi:hypothetical protein